MGNVPSVPGFLAAVLNLTLALSEGKVVVKGEAGEAGPAVARLNKPFWYALDAEQKKQVRRGGFSDPLSTKIRSYTGEWRSFTTDFCDWTKTMRTEAPCENVLSEAGIFRPLLTIHFGTGLIFEGLDAEGGTLTFRVADPIDPAKLRIELPDTPDAERTARELRDYLKPLAGKPWCRSRIEARVREFFAKRGVKPDIESLDPRGPILRVRRGSTP